MVSPTHRETAFMIWLTLQRACKTTLSGSRRVRSFRLVAEALEPRWNPALPTPMEQETLELINRFRSDPTGEFERLISGVNPYTSPIPGVAEALTFFNTNPTVLRNQLASLTPAPPLAWSDSLSQAATNHNQLMIQFDQQSHQLPGEPGLGTRVTNAGYTNWSNVAENVFAFAESAAHAHAGFVLDWGSGPDGIQSPPGHRINLINPVYREIGVAFVAETNPDTQVGPFVTTQVLGARFNSPDFLVGVVYDDTNTNAFYDAGEGLGGVNVTATGAAGLFRTTTWATGGYQLELPTGTYQVEFSGAALSQPVTKSVTVVKGRNAKVDLDRSRDITDPPPQPGRFRFETTTVQVVEGAAVQVTIQRIGGTDGTVTVSLARAGGTATPGVDFNAATLDQVITFGPGVNSFSVLVSTLDDTLVESTETIVLELRDPTNGASLAAPIQTTISIVDNDETPPPPPPPPPPLTGLFGFTVVNSRVRENLREVRLMVRRTGPLSQPATVMFNTNDLTARAGQDYVARAGVLQFAAGQRQTTLTVRIRDDRVAEPTEQFRVALAQPSTGLGLTPGREAVTVSILDNDRPRGRTLRASGTTRRPSASRPSLPGPGWLTPLTSTRWTVPALRRVSPRVD